MTLKKFSVAVMILSCVALFGLSACNDSSDDDDVVTPTAISTYSEDVAECTPQIEASSENAPGAEENASINTWAGWDPTIEYTVFNKLLAANSAEGLYDPISKADEFVEMINGLSEYWETDVTNQTVTIPVVGETVVLTVETNVTSVTVPFFGGTQAVDRVVTVEGSGEGMGTYQCKVAFTTSAAGAEAMVVRTEFTDTGEISVLYGQKAVDGQLDIWAACYADKATETTADDFYGAFKWRGNPDEKWFALTQYMNGASGSKVLAGGEPDGEMAFLAIRGDEGTTPYYLVSTIANITGGTALADSSIINATTTPPLESTSAVLKYIEEGNTACLGYLTEYPDSEDDLVWAQQ